MTRLSWATDKQREWLEARKAAFLESKQKGITSKEFFPVVIKDFCKKWPVPPVTKIEIDEAGSAEQASKVKCDKYQKHLREWFHNNTRNVASKSGPHGGILDMKPKPKMLQAYQALTYDSTWKPHVDELWANYKEGWDTEHSGKKPPRSRLSVMAEFMKEKYEAEDDTMKERCEEYRKNRKESPLNLGPEQERNLAFQSAINKIPLMLSTIGESIMEKTGWNITIMAGGPAPSRGGMIMSYLSHTGKTKDGDTFEKFLGKKEYDQRLLEFERFLHASFSQNDHDSRSLIKSEADDANKVHEINDEDMDLDDGMGGGESSKKATVKNAKNPAFEDYIQTKEKNIAELKVRLDEVKAQYPIAGEREEPKTLKKTLKKSQAMVDLLDKNKANESPTSTELAPSVLPVPTDTTAQPVEPTNNSGELDCPAQTANPNDTQKAPSCGPTTNSVAQVSSPTPAVLDVDGEECAPTVNVVSVTSSDVEMTDLAVSASNSPTHNNTNLPKVDSTNHPIECPSKPQNDSAPNPSNDDGANTSNLDGSNSPKGDDSNPANDSVPTSPNDNGAPAWLTLRLQDLRGTSGDATWQGLVTELVDFEKCGLPNSNLPTKLRPQAISDWIKSKKKSDIPDLNLMTYGTQFKGWWMALQPPWRKDGETLLRDVPQSETWQTLRKGGTAGIYVVVVGLSWWINAWLM